MSKPRLALGVLALALAATGCAGTNPVSPGLKTALLPPGALIDDFEGSPPQNNFGGYWFTYADENGTRIDPGPTAAITFSHPGSPLTPGNCFRLVGAFGPTVASKPLYAGFGCGLNAQNLPVDFSRYQGVQFFCRGGIQVPITFILKKKSVMEDSAHFRMTFTAPAEWTLVQIPFSALVQPANAQPVPFSATDVTAVQWTPSKVQVGIDFQVDDIQLY